MLTPTYVQICGGLIGDKVTPSEILSLTYAARATPRLADT